LIGVRVVLLIAICLSPMAAVAQEPARNPQAIRAELSKLRQRIDALNQTLAEHDRQRDVLSDEVREIDQRINDNLREQRHLAQQTSQENARLRRLKRSQSDARIALSRQGDLLAESLRAAYALGNGRGLKLVFAKTSPAELGRVMAYYGYFNRARARQMQSTRDALLHLRHLAEQILSRKQSLKKLAGKTKRQLAAEHTARAQRQTLIVRLDERVREQQRSLRALDDSRSHLQDLLDGLLDVLADIPGDVDSGRPFASLHGRLAWPSAGRLNRTTGTDRKHAGVLINIRAGTPIRVVAHGRVVFAEWLRGFGLMVIVDHNDGYMSLYAHADTLFKDVGDWVERGDVLGQVGTSGGLAHAGLYFEIRHNGAPVSVRHWFKNTRPPAA